ncbi:prolactin-inducible protein [Rousettus aegyptiacus]|uniref:Prolactin-inducible protein homolog n=1 Tax=Rousettus aegyptiacus TaxID=9407 RepID=A0A7J8D7K5_ROUAE|nr:prolactin-inducible protein [Rousettus aegyptiacus]KAF6419141.1 prolactin induced protein [Rousettus aegyptiacus]
MHALQLLFRPSHVTLLLVLWLQLGTNKAQEDNRKVMIMDVEIPQTAKADEEVTLKLVVKTELRECMVVKSYLVSSRPVDGPFNYKFTACLCPDYPRTFFWDFQSNNTVTIATVVDVIRQLNICPNNKAVIPIEANRFHVLNTLWVY